MTANSYPYTYRVRKANPSVTYTLAHFRKLERAQDYIARFLSPTSSDSCAPRRGHPFHNTVVYLEQRVSWETWRVVGTYTYAEVTA